MGIQNFLFVLYLWKDRKTCFLYFFTKQLKIYHIS